MNDKEEYKPIYPPLDVSHTDRRVDEKLHYYQKFNTTLQDVKEIKQILESDLKKYEKKYNNIKKANCLNQTVQMVVVIGGSAVSIPLMLTGLFLPEGFIIGGAVAGTLGTLNSISTYLMNRYRRRYSRVILLCKTILLEYNNLLEEALKDNFVNEKEYNKLTTKYKFYKDNKSTIKQNTEITKEGLTGVANDAKDKLIKELLGQLQSVQSKNGLPSI